jgi:hypothetical protein
MRRLWIGVVAVAALAGAGLADHFYDPVPPVPAADRPAEPGGVWVCPVVKVAGAGGFIHIVNTGNQRATVRITYVPDGKKPLEQALTVAPLHATTVGSPGSLATQNAGAIVEYAGGDVTVSRTVLIGGIGDVPRGAGAGGLSAGAASCARPGGVVQVVPQGATLRTETQLAIMNPGTADAVVNITLVSNGQELKPVSLQGRIVPARRRLIIREGDFVFDARAVGAIITADTGRIVADALLVARSTADLVPGMNATRDLVAIASSARGTAAFTTLAVGQNDAVIRAYLLSGEGRTAYSPLATALPPNSPQVASAPIAGVPAGAVALAATSDTSPLAIGARWAVRSSTGKVDSATSSGVIPSGKAVAVVGQPATTKALRLLVANPDKSEAVLNIQVITESGAATAPGLQNVHLAPGKAMTLPFPTLTDGATVGVIVTSVGARIAALIEAIAAPPNSFAAYAVAAVPVLESPPVAVEPDARQGVPAG